MTLEKLINNTKTKEFIILKEGKTKDSFLSLFRDHFNISGIEFYSYMEKHVNTKYGINEELLQKFYNHNNSINELEIDISGNLVECNYTILCMHYSSTSYYNGNIYLEVMKNNLSFEETLDFISYKIENKEIGISPLTCLDFMIKLLTNDNLLERNIASSFDDIGNETSYLLFEKVLSTNNRLLNISKINMDNFNKICSCCYKVSLLSVCTKFFSNDKYKLPIILNFIEDLSGYSSRGYYRNGYHNYTTMIRQLLNLLDNAYYHKLLSEMSLKELLIDSLKFLTHRKKSDYALSVFPDVVIDNNFDIIFDNIVDTKEYSYGFCARCATNVDKIDVSRINKSLFIKKSNSLLYNKVAGEGFDNRVVALSNILFSNTTLPYERLQMLTCFLNMFELEELKKLDLSLLVTAIVDRILSKNSNEIGKRSINLLIGKDIINLKYFCDLIVDDIVRNKTAISVKVKTICECSKMSNNNTLTLAILLLESLNKRDETAVVKALVKNSL